MSLSLSLSLSISLALSLSATPRSAWFRASHRAPARSWRSSCCPVTRGLRAAGCAPFSFSAAGYELASNVTRCRANMPHIRQSSARNRDRRDPLSRVRAFMAGPLWNEYATYTKLAVVVFPINDCRKCQRRVTYTTVEASVPRVASLQVTSPAVEQTCHIYDSCMYDCRANMPHIRQSRPYVAIGFRAAVKRIGGGATSRRETGYLPSPATQTGYLPCFATQTGCAPSSATRAYRPSQHATYTAVKARFWPCLSGETP